MSARVPLGRLRLRAVVRRDRHRAAGRHRGAGGGVIGFVLGGLFVALGVARLDPAAQGGALMARKLRGFERVLDAPALFAVAYGEIGSSIYFALGIVAAHALGLTPVVLLLTGLPVPRRLALLRRGHGGDPRDRRRRDASCARAFNDLFGFVTGWALFLDYLIVIALSALFLPHYLGARARHRRARRRARGTSSSASSWSRRSRACGSCGARACTPARIAIAGLDLVVQLLLDRARLRAARLAGRADERRRPRRVAGVGRPRLRAAAGDARLHRPRDRREPRRGDPRAGTRAAAQPLLRDRARRRADGARSRSSASRRSRPRTARPRSATSGCGRRSSASSPRSTTALPALVADALRVAVGLTGALVLLAAATTSMSGCTRLAYSMAKHGQLPREFGRLNRRTLVSPAGDRGDGGRRRSGLVILTGAIDEDVAFLASLYSFGVLLAFTAAQLAVIRLRASEPDLPRPFRVPLDVTIRGVRVPLPALIGAPLTAAVLGRRAGHAPGRPLRRPRVAGRRARRLPADAPSGPRSGCWRTSSRSASAAGSRVPQPARADEARRHRRGDGRDRRGARQGARRGRRGALRRSACRWRCRSTRSSSMRRSTPRPRSRRRGCSARSTASRCAPRWSRRGRSATRSSRRRARGTST